MGFVLLVRDKTAHSLARISGSRTYSKLQILFHCAHSVSLQWSSKHLPINPPLFIKTQQQQQQQQQKPKKQKQKQKTAPLGMLKLWLLTYTIVLPFSHSHASVLIL